MTHTVQSKDMKGQRTERIMGVAVKSRRDLFLVASGHRRTLDGLAGEPAGELVGVLRCDVAGVAAGLGPQEYVKELKLDETMSEQK